jgi:hypothetical protein
MCRAVNVENEYIVVSGGKQDIGKFAILGNDGKFDPSVIPGIEDLQKQIDNLKGASKVYDVLWSGNVGTNTNNAVTNTMTLSKPLTGYEKIGVLFTADDGNLVRPQYREFTIAQFTTIINSSTNDHVLSCVWGYFNHDDYSDIQNTSTYTSLMIKSNKSYVNEIRGIY